MKPNEIKKVVITQPTGTQRFFERVESTSPCEIHFDIDVACDTADPMPLYIHFAGQGAGARNYTLSLTNAYTLKKVFDAVQTLHASGNAYARIKANIDPDFKHRLTVKCPASVKKYRLGIFPYYEPPVLIYIGVHRSQQIDISFP